MTVFALDLCTSAGSLPVFLAMSASLLLTEGK
jgi:hypothetical protein